MISRRLHRIAAAAAAVGGAGALAAGCATDLRPGLVTDNALAWHAHALAAELDALDPADPRYDAIEAPLARIIAAHEAIELARAPAPAAHAFAAAPDLPELPVSQVLHRPRFAPVAVEMLAPLTIAFTPAPQPAPSMAAVAPPPPAPTGPPSAIALGQFADADLAASVWAELSSVNLAGLAGLSGHVVSAEDGVVLMAGPLPNEAAAQSRCVALSGWGIACAPAVLRDGARALSGARGAAEG